MQALMRIILQTGEDQKHSEIQGLCYKKRFYHMSATKNVVKETPTILGNCKFRKTCYALVSKKERLQVVKEIPEGHSFVNQKQGNGYVFVCKKDNNIKFICQCLRIWSCGPNNLFTTVKLVHQLSNRIIASKKLQYFVFA